MQHEPEHDPTSTSPGVGPDDPTPVEGIPRPDEDAPGNYVDDPDADEIPEPNEPA